ncbi:MAG TPA: nucleoside deaminase [Burkholderiales bacterium]|nr:nucleoside deaminase [Burkholderiales bacterium]
MSRDHAFYMQRALELARAAAAKGNRPVASLLVRGDEVIAEGENAMFTSNDPSAHAEVVAIRQACARLATLDLSGTTLYSTLEPCPMCFWCMQEAKIGRLVLGGRYAGIGRTDLGRYSIETIQELTARRIELVTGVLDRECEALRLQWMRARGR